MMNLSCPIEKNEFNIVLHDDSLPMPKHYGLIKKTVRQAFTHKAVIDWIEFIISTDEFTQFQWIQSQLKRILDLGDNDKDIFVIPINPENGGISRNFKIRLHDQNANNFDQINHVFKRLSLKFPFSEQPTISGIELAVDFYSREANEQRQLSALLALTERLQTGIAAYDNPRQFDPKMNANRFYHLDAKKDQSENKINPNQNFRTGYLHSLIHRQIYLKRTDNNKRPILQNLWRARAEFTLFGLELENYKIKDIDSLRKLCFEDLSGLLTFRKLKPLEQITAGMDKTVSLAIKRHPNWRNCVSAYSLGFRKYRYDSRTGKPRKTYIRKHSSHTTSDDEINRIIQSGMKQLTKSFRKKM